MFKLLFISVLFFITVSFAKRDPEEIIKDLDARLEAIDQLVEQKGSLDTATCSLNFDGSNALSGEGVCALGEYEEENEYFSCEDSDSENADIPVAAKADETSAQKGWFSGIKSYFGY